MINVRRSINEHEVKHSSNGFIIKSSDGGRGKRKGRETGDRLCKVTRIRFREPGFEKKRKKKKIKNSPRYEKRRYERQLVIASGFFVLSRTKILSSSRCLRRPTPLLLLQLLFILSRSICIIFKFKYTERQPSCRRLLFPTCRLSLPPLLASFLGADGGQLATRCLVTPRRNCRPRENNAEVDTIT